MQKSNLKYLPLVVILFSLFLRLPVIYMWNNSMVIGEDGALYMETAKNFAEGNGYYCSMLRHFATIETTKDYISKNGLKDRMEWIPPLFIFLISLLYLVFGENWFIFSINIFNLFLFAVLLLLYYRYLKENYPDNHFIINFSLIFIGMNFIFFEFSLGPHFESIYLLTFFIAFLQHIKMIKKEKLTIQDYIIYALSLSLFTFSKFSSIPFVAAFLIHFLIRRKIKNFIFVSLFSFIMISPWMFIRSYLISGHPLAALIRGRFPFSDTTVYSGFANNTIHSIYSYFLDFIYIFEYYISIDGFFIFFPFIIISILELSRKDEIKSTATSLIIGCIIFFGLTWNEGTSRYQFLLILPFIPIGLMKMIELLKNLKYKKVFYFIVILIFVWSQMFRISEFYNVVRKSFQLQSQKMKNAVELIDSNNISKDKVILVNMAGINYYVENPVVLLSVGMNEKNKFEMINTYSIDYILFVQGEPKLQNDVFYDLKLIRKSPNDTNIKLYSVY